MVLLVLHGPVSRSIGRCKAGPTSLGLSWSICVNNFQLITGFLNYLLGNEGHTYRHSSPTFPDRTENPFPKIDTKPHWRGETVNKDMKLFVTQQTHKTKIRRCPVRCCKRHKARAYKAVIQSMLYEASVQSTYVRKCTLQRIAKPTIV